MTPQRSGAPLKKARSRAIPPKKKVAGITLPPEPAPEPGRDLSTVPMCQVCGLEVSNVNDHRNWHNRQDGQFKILQSEIAELKRMLQRALEGTAIEMPAIHGSSEKLTYFDEVDKTWDRAKENIDQDYYFKRRKEANYHRQKVSEELKRKNTMPNVPSGKENW